MEPIPHHESLDTPPAVSGDFVVVISTVTGPQTVDQLVASGVSPDAILAMGFDGSLFATPVNGLTILTGSLQSDVDVDHSLGDLVEAFGASQAYDCVVVLALAARAVGVDDGGVLREAVSDVTRDGVTCSSYGECAELLDDGEDIDYDGVSGPIAIGEAGSPRADPFRQWQDDEVVDVDDTFVTFDE